MLVIGRSFWFDAAHRLPNHEGKCCHLHGHTYRLDVEVTGEMCRSGPQNGMVMDFGELKTLVNECIEHYDHHNLNEIFPIPTAEEMVCIISQNIRRKLPEGVNMVCCRLWEGTGPSQTFAEWRAD